MTINEIWAKNNKLQSVRTTQCTNPCSMQGSRMKHKKSKPFYFANGPNKRKLTIFPRAMHVAGVEVSGWFAQVNVHVLYVCKHLTLFHTNQEENGLIINTYFHKFDPLKCKMARNKVHCICSLLACRNTNVIKMD